MALVSAAAAAASMSLAQTAYAQGGVWLNTPAPPTVAASASSTTAAGGLTGFEIDETIGYGHHTAYSGHGIVDFARAGYRFIPSVSAGLGIVGDMTLARNGGFGFVLRTGLGPYATAHFGSVLGSGVFDPSLTVGVNFGLTSAVTGVGTFVGVASPYVTLNLKFVFGQFGFGVFGGSEVLVSLYEPGFPTQFAPHVGISIYRVVRWL